MELLFNCILYIAFIILAITSIITLKFALTEENAKLKKITAQPTYSFTQILAFLFTRFTFLEILMVRKNRFKISHLLTLAIPLLTSLLFEKSYYWSWLINAIFCVIIFMIVEIYLSQKQSPENPNEKDQQSFYSNKIIIYGIYTLLSVLIYTNCCYLLYYTERDSTFLYLNFVPSLLLDHIFARPAIFIGAALLRNQFFSILLLKQAEDLLNDSNVQHLHKQTTTSILPILNDEYKRKIRILSPSKRPKTIDNFQTDSNLIEPKPTLINNISTDMDSMINFLQQSQKRRIYRSRFNLSMNTGNKKNELLATQGRTKTNKNSIDNSILDLTDQKNNNGEELRFKTSRYINDFCEKTDINNKNIIRSRNQNNNASVTQSKIEDDTNNHVITINQTEHEASKKCFSNSNSSKNNYENQYTKQPVINTFSIKDTNKNDSLKVVILETINLSKQNPVNSVVNVRNMLQNNNQRQVNKVKQQQQLDNQSSTTNNKQLKNQVTYGYISQVGKSNTQKSYEKQYRTNNNHHNSSEKNQNTRYSLMKIPQQVQIEQLSELNLNPNIDLKSNQILTPKKNINIYFSTNLDKIPQSNHRQIQKNIFSPSQRESSQKFKSMTLPKSYLKTAKDNKINNQNICPYQQSQF